MSESCCGATDVVMTWQILARAAECPVAVGDVVGLVRVHLCGLTPAGAAP